MEEPTDPTDVQYEVMFVDYEETVSVGADEIIPHGNHTIDVYCFIVVPSRGVKGSGVQFPERWSCVEEQGLNLHRLWTPSSNGYQVELKLVLWELLWLIL